MAAPMSDITLVLQAVGRGEKRASEELLPLLYDELRRLVAARQARLKRGGDHLRVAVADVDNAAPTPAGLKNASIFCRLV
jgi:hypothetical protein